MVSVDRKSDRDNLKKTADNIEKITNNRKRDLILSSVMSGIIGAIVGFFLGKFF